MSHEDGANCSNVEPLIKDISGKTTHMVASIFSLQSFVFFSAISILYRVYGGPIRGIEIVRSVRRKCSTKTIYMPCI